MSMRWLGKDIGVSGGKELSGRWTELTLLRCSCSDPEPCDPFLRANISTKAHMGQASWTGMGNKLENFLLRPGEKDAKKQ